MGIICWHEENRIDRKELFVQTDLKGGSTSSSNRSSYELQKSRTAGLGFTAADMLLAAGFEVITSDIVAYRRDRQHSFILAVLDGSAIVPPASTNRPYWAGNRLAGKYARLAPRPGSGSGPTVCPDSKSAALA